MRYVINALYQNLNHPDLPVKVEAALALNKLLCHEEAVEFLRPALKDLLQTYLKIMDDIDFDDMVNALKEIVEVFENDIAPYAYGLC